MSEDKYFDALERFADKYSKVKGVISIEPDQFGADIIVVLLDDKRYKTVDLPSSYEGYEVSTVGTYQLRDVYDTLVSNAVLNEPSIWDVNYEVPFKTSLDILNNHISSYEERVDASIQNSLIRIKNSLQWTIDNVPVNPEE